jgi:hypothetical protein
VSGGIGSLAISSWLVISFSVLADLEVGLGGRSLSVVVVIVVVVIIVRAVATNEDVSSVWEFSSGTGKDISACTDEVWGEGELLAVEDKDISVFISSFLGLSALSLESLDSLLLVRDL